MAREQARKILARIAAEEEARTTREIRAFGLPDRAEIAVEAGERFGAYLRGKREGGALALTAARDKTAALADWLIAAGADHVTVAAVEGVFSARNVLWERLAGRIGM